MSSLCRVQHPQKFSKCSISDYKEFLLKGGGSCLFNRPTKVSRPFSQHVKLLRTRAPFTPSCPLLTAVRGSKLWEWICRTGRGVRLRTENSEGLFTSPRHARPFVIFSLFRCLKLVSLCFQDCQKECCKKCSLANGAHCSDGPCCNKTCLVQAWFFLFKALKN